MRLDKLLSDMQVGTRSEIKKYIKAGLVTVNGGAASPQLKVGPEDTRDFPQAVGILYAL